MSIISKVIYGGADLLIALFLTFLSTQVPWSDVVAIFLFGRALMSLAGAYLPPYTLQSKLFYGTTDIAMGAFLVSNSVSIGYGSGQIGTFLAARGTLTWLNIEL